MISDRFWPQGMDHISVKKLWEENLTRYVYFPRLRDREVFTKAVQEGATSHDFFGYAVGYENGKYVGLCFGQRPASILMDEGAVIVRKDVAEAVAPTVPVPPDPSGDSSNGPVTDALPTPGTRGQPQLSAKVMRRFYGSVKLSELKVSSGAGQVADEVIKHLAGLVDSDVEVILEVRARAPGGIPDSVVRSARTPGR